MNEKKKYFIVALAAAVLTLMVSAGLALAQDETATVEDADAIGARDGHGPGGFAEKGENRDQMVGGEVVSVSDTAITLTTKASDEEVAVTINGDTAYFSKEKADEAALADVVPGEHVGIWLTEARAEGVEMVAGKVMIGAPHRGDKPHADIGAVTAIDGNNVTISTADGEKQFTIPTIEAGMELGVAADEEGNVKAVIYDPPEKPADAPENAE
jgi:hypothetical protein